MGTMLRDVCRPKAGLDFPEELAMFRQHPGLSLAVLVLGALAPWGAWGGLQGGKARAAKLTPERRREIA